MNTQAGTFLIACRPILTSDEKGPARGALVMGRRLDASLIGSLSKQTQLNITISALNGRDVPPDVAASFPSLDSPGAMRIVPLDSENIAGYKRFDDIYGRPAVVLKVASPRLTYQQGTSAVVKYILVVIGIIVAIGVALNLALSAWVLTPLRRIVRQVKGLAAKQTHKGRIEVGKGAEFAILGREINHLLDELETAQNEVSHLYGVAREQADRDPVTGLLSRRAIFEALERALKSSKGRGGKLALMMIDVDGFKLFNDAHGHLAGDAVLRALGKALASHSREGDLVGRYGGDEFLVILRNTDAQGAASQAERLLDAADDLSWTTPDGTEAPVSLSIGVSAFPSHGSELNELIAFADANLYAAKQKGRHAVASGTFSGEAEMNDYGFGMLDSLITALSEKDHYTRRHSEEVASDAVRIGEALGLDGSMIRALRIAGLLHDVGKTGIPASLLLRPGPLTAQESGLLRRHVEIGLALIRDVPELTNVLSAVGAHHEQVNGSGYPKGLTGDDIPLAGRILAVADSYSAMVSHRPYRRARAPENARQELRRMAGSQLDDRLVKVFLSLHGAGRDAEATQCAVDDEAHAGVVWLPQEGVT